MEITAESKQKYGMPSSPISADYQCPKCGKKWRHDRQQNSIAELA